MPLDPGTQVGRFKVVRLIAQGGMAEVYRAEQELAAGFARRAALKVIRPEYAESEDFREMFLDEARTACTLSHPNIVHIYEVDELDGLLYMAMELVPGETLSAVGRALREKGQRLSDESLLAVGIFTCAALEAVHALQLPGEGHLKLVHRDVSPQNLLVTPAGTLKLIDFGIAKAASNRNLTSPGITKGKAGYFSPEQALGKLLDGRSDVFSLGVTLYKLASGVTPFDQHKSHEARNDALLTGQWEPLERVCPGLPPGFYEVIARALKVKAEDRFPDAASMREALEGVALEAGVAVGPSSLAGLVEEDESENSQVSQVTRPQNRPGKKADPSGGRPKLTLEAPRTGAGRRHHTDRVEKVAVSSRPPWLIPVVTAAGVAALVLGTAVVVSALGRPDARVEPSAPAPATPKPTVVAVAKPPPPKPVEPAAPVVALPKEPVVEPTPPAEPSPLTAPKPKPPRPSPPKPSPVVVAEPPPEEIPEGKGTLRIGASQESQVFLSGRKLGLTPQNLNGVSSGIYKLAFETSSGRGNCSVKVLPDKKTMVIYDAAREKCDVDFR